MYTPRRLGVGTCLLMLFCLLQVSLQHPSGSAEISSSSGWSPLHFGFVIGAEGAARRGRRGKYAPKPKPPPKKYTHPIDAILDETQRICSKLAVHVKRKRFDGARRCDLIMEVVEDYRNQLDAMAKDIGSNIVDMANAVFRFPHIQPLQTQLRRTCVTILRKKHPVEDDVKRTFSEFNMWTTKLATLAKESKSNVEKMSREEVRQLRGNTGIEHPDFDEDSEEYDYALHADESYDGIIPDDMDTAAAFDPDAF